MRNYDARIKKIEGILLPKKNMVVIIGYITDEPTSFIEIDGIQHIIPQDINVKEFINKKTKHFRGVVTCTVYLAKNKRL